MNRNDLVSRVRSFTRDLSNSIFRQQDIEAYINEGIDRFRQFIPELMNMTYLFNANSIPNLLPEQYHYLLAVYATSRCFSQDENYYQATTFMNEFETKLDELKSKIESGEVVIRDENGKVVVSDIDTDSVTNVYFKMRKGRKDLDFGVEGVE